MMKLSFKAIGGLALVLFATLASSSAMAQHRGHGHGGNVRFGISFAVPVFPVTHYPLHYYPYPGYFQPLPLYRYPAPVVVTAPPPVYVERDPSLTPPAAAPAQADWYYCATAKAYYPYVAECPAGWQRVPAQPHPH